MIRRLLVVTIVVLAGIAGTSIWQRQRAKGYP